MPADIAFLNGHDLAVYSSRWCPDCARLDRWMQERGVENRKVLIDEEPAAAEKLESETGSRPEWRAHAFSDLEQDVRDSVAAIEASPFIPRTGSVRGFIYDVDTGSLREVG